MSFQKFKFNSYCVGHEGYSNSKNIVGEVSFNKKTGKENIISVGQCSMCNRKTPMIVTNIIIQAEGLVSFFKVLGKIFAKAGKKLATNVIKNPVRGLQITSNLLLQLQLKALKQLYHRYLKFLFFIIRVKVRT